MRNLLDRRYRDQPPRSPAPGAFARCRFCKGWGCIACPQESEREIQQNLLIERLKKAGKDNSDGEH